MSSSYRHACVRDLAWALRSPPLLRTPAGEEQVRWLDEDWCERAYQAYAPRLAELDHNPAALLAHLQEKTDKRLGSQFEALLEFWLADPANGRYRLLAHGLPIRSGKQTLGELDFVVQELASGEIEHWEVAIRFYLGTQPDHEQSSWIGIDPSDRLDLKVGRLRQHQLPMSQTVAGLAALAELGIHKHRSACLLKGRLFYPLGVDVADWQPQDANPGHGRGWWLPIDALAHLPQPPELSWALLPREYRMAELTPDVRISESDKTSFLIEPWPAGFDNRPVAVVSRRDGEEQERGFFCPPGWPAPQAQEHI